MPALKIKKIFFWRNVGVFYFCDFELKVNPSSHVNYATLCLTQDFSAEPNFSETLLNKTRLTIKQRRGMFSRILSLILPYALTVMSHNSTVEALDILTYF